MSLKHFKTNKIMEGEFESFHTCIWFFVILKLPKKKIEMVKKISTKKEFKKRETYT